MVALAPSLNYDNYSHIIGMDGPVSKVRMEDLKEMAALPANATPLGVPAGQPVFSTQQLFGGASEIAIVHQGLTYRLRITRQGKLVLNK